MHVLTLWGMAVGELRRPEDGPYLQRQLRLQLYIRNLENYYTRLLYIQSSSRRHRKLLALYLELQQAGIKLRIDGVSRKVLLLPSPGCQVQVPWNVVK